VPKILIVDDLAANRELLSAILAREGHQIIEAKNGSEGLAAARRDLPDLVITDVLMPVMDGYEFVKQLRLDATTSGIPVVFHTAHYGQREARALALTQGVTYILTKPAGADDVLKIVHRVLSGESDATASEVAPPTIEFDREHLRIITDKLSEKADEQRAANARLRAMINLGLDFASGQDSDLRLQNLCASVSDLFCATYINLGIVDRSDRTPRRFFSCGADSIVWRKTGEAPSGILWTVLAERRTMRGENPGGDPASLQLPWLEPEVQTYLVAPLASPSHVYGWICLVGNDGTTFTDEDENLVMALAGQVGRIYALEHEILERKHAESALRHERDRANRTVEALRTAEERMRFALQSANVGIWDADYTSGEVVWSETLEAHYGLKPGTFEGTFEAFIESIYPEDRESVIETIATAAKSGGDFSIQNRAILPDGAVRWLNGAGRIELGENGEPVRGIGISLDVTDRVSFEEKNQQGQRMEAIGRLASGVAHDFNNLLTAILGFAELISADPAIGPQQRDDLGEIINAARRAARLTNQLLAFSRQQVMHPASLDLNGLIREMTGMLGRLIGEHIEVSLTLSADLHLALADRSQIEQVVMNLVVNARDSMPDGGKLTVVTTNVELESSSFHDQPMKEGRYVMLAVTDTGHGMTRETQRRLFEPFYTTKELGKGTGLGLSTTYGIVKQSKGYIWVYSEPGRGATFKVYLPCADSDVVAATASNGATASDQKITETVLLVEDEDGVREFSRRTLVNAGYQVIESSNGNDAERLFEEHEGSIDIVLTDVVMPGCGGPELLKRLRLRAPNLKVLYMSGYTDQSAVTESGLDPDLRFLQKPFRAVELLRNVRELLDGSGVALS
jgi:signal transduction histidine kinase/DNA-binding response OmpR family regulator